MAAGSVAFRPVPVGPGGVERQTYTVGESATILGLSRQTVQRMVDRGELPRVQTSAAAVVIPRWAVDELVVRPADVHVPEDLLRGLLVAAAAGADVELLIVSARAASGGVAA